METSDEYLSVEKIACYIGAKVSVTGIVENTRNQGGLLFIDLKDDDCLIQVLVTPDNSGVYAMSQKIENGHVVEVKGVIRECPASIKEEDGPKKVEIKAENISIISARKGDENRQRDLLTQSAKLMRNKKIKK